MPQQVSRPQERAGRRCICPRIRTCSSKSIGRHASATESLRQRGVDHRNPVDSFPPRGRRNLRVRAEPRSQVMAPCTVEALPRDVERDAAMLSEILLRRVVGGRHVVRVGFYTYATRVHARVPQLTGDGFGARS